MTKAIPGAGGMDWKKFSNARRPPADAPMMTTGNGAASFSGLIANFVGPVRGRLMNFISLPRTGPTKLAINPENDAAPFPVVIIGASAGGLRALENFFQSIPPAPGMAFVIITHLAPDRKSLLNE